MRFAPAVMLAATLSSACPAFAAAPDWGKVDQALGRSGAAMPGDVHRYGFPRSDLHVTVDGVTLLPALRPRRLARVQGRGRRAMVMGDLVLTEDEINPVMSKLLAGGIGGDGRAQSPAARTACHVLHACRRTWRRDELGHDIARRACGQPYAACGARRAASAKPDLDAEQIEQALGRKGNAVGGVLQFGIPRGDAIVDGGMPVPPAMGTATAVNFQPTGGGKAAITGDFVLEAKEVEPVLAALRDAGIEVTALHNHMLNDQPRTFFVHFWANDDAVKLAHGIRAALDKVNVAKS